MVLPANMGPTMTWTSPEGRAERSLVMGIEGLKEAMEVVRERERERLRFLDLKKRNMGI